jgi:hypothetical protein
MKKLFVVLILSVFSFALMGQKNNDLYVKMPKEVKDLFKDKQYIPFDNHVKSILEKYKNELFALEAEQYTAYQEELKKGGPAIIPPPAGPWTYQQRCNHYGCGYMEVCWPVCTWRWGCGECMSYVCPACGMSGAWLCYIGCCWCY